MKAVLTGHTRGVGKWISEYLVQKDIEVIGFSRTEGKDVELPEVQNEIVDACRNADIFFNNVHSSFTQVELLRNVFEIWKDSKKRIINIGAGHFRPEIWQLVDSQYTAEKAALHALVQTLQSHNPVCQLSLLSLGIMDTENCSDLPPPKISKEIFHHSLEYLMTAPESLGIETLSLRPRSLL